MMKELIRSVVAMVLTFIVSLSLGVALYYLTPGKARAQTESPAATSTPRPTTAAPSPTPQVPVGAPRTGRG
ncbi:hypothetical protein A2Z33_06410 [Candidatus Gottesmanbacteria bacterium RBG_16_52_11]|uniref:Uncharacterized protein n=1 Tax=Candidatus Gottesmanbacteria bacterium RBG_16_52_11 TaxID=1798374 RepID=A0A1F5YXT2_9BACT|nr:MAG: hypothetical protein A2Z33_06410 [Candidatus Gottesmanbacteria bacterium RBG_16_52_11]